MEHIWKTNINSDKNSSKKEKTYMVFDSKEKRIKKRTDSESNIKYKKDRKYESDIKEKHKHRSSKNEYHYTDKYRKRDSEFKEPTVNDNYLTDEIRRHNDTRRIDFNYPNPNNNRYQNNNYQNNRYQNNNYQNNRYQNNNYRNNNSYRNDNFQQQGGYRKKNYYQPQLKNDVLEAIEKVDVKKSEKEPKKTNTETDTEKNYIKIPVNKNCKGFFVIPTNSKSNIQNIINAVNNSEPVKKKVTSKKKITNNKSKKINKKVIK